jgi:DNA-binding transcriptional MerR regulator
VQAQQPAKVKGEFREPPHQAFVNRVKREAAMEVKRQLGCTIEEAKALVQKSGAQPASGDKSAEQKTVDKALEEAKREVREAREEAVQLKGQNESLKKKHEKEVKRLKNKQFEAQLSAAASKAGIVDTDYAVTLFAREVAKGTGEVDPDVFFAGLKETKPHLFGATTTVAATTTVVPPVVVPPTTAPKESAAPGEETPKPSVPGATPPQKTADDDTPEEFNARLRRSGWQPGS